MSGLKILLACALLLLVLGSACAKAGHSGAARFTAPTDPKAAAALKELQDIVASNGVCNFEVEGETSGFRTVVQGIEGDRLYFEEVFEAEDPTGKGKNAGYSRTYEVPLAQLDLDQLRTIIPESNELAGAPKSFYCILQIAGQEPLITRRSRVIPTGKEVAPQMGNACRLRLSSSSACEKAKQVIRKLAACYQPQ